LVERRWGQSLQGLVTRGWRAITGREHFRRNAAKFVLKVLIGLGATALGFTFVIWLGTLHYYNLGYAEAILPALGQGLLVTIRLVAVVIPLGFALGFLLGWARTTGSLVLRGLGAVYVEVFRGLPPIVLIFFAYLITTLAILNLSRNPFFTGDLALWMGAIALALHSGAYQTEIIRAGILSVPTGQLEAADSIGMSRWQTMFRVTLPQAFRVSLPALGNEFASVIKDTSLLNIIGWFDLAQVGLLQVPSAIKTDFNLVFIIWIEIAMLYFLLTFVVTKIVRFVENLYQVPGLEAAEL
jgi:glutamine transport system permease protein